MRPARLGAVSYLNTRPLVHGLEARVDLFTLRFDVPSVCAKLLHGGRLDVGLIPAIEYLRGEYAIAPGVAIGSDGPVDSVAVFSKLPIAEVRSLALDTSSRTSVALTRILCARYWGIAPAEVEAEPDLDRMLASADAALIIGDPALVIDPDARGLLKYDLGQEWRAMTGLPFVYAMWCGQRGVLDAGQVEALQVARDRGLADVAGIARDAAAGDLRPGMPPVTERKALVYLRDTLKYGLGAREIAGLERFHALAAELDLVPDRQPLRFYP